MVVTGSFSDRLTDLSLSGVTLHEIVGLELFLLVGHDARHLEHEARLRGVLLQPGGRGMTERQSCFKWDTITFKSVYLQIDHNDGARYFWLLVPSSILGYM